MDASHYFETVVVFPHVNPRNYNGHFVVCTKEARVGRGRSVADSPPRNYLVSHAFGRMYVQNTTLGVGI